MFGVQTITASAVGMAALGDATRPGFEAPTAIGFVAALGGALALAFSESAPRRLPAAHQTLPARFVDG
jgi:hypothetical protein